MSAKKTLQKFTDSEVKINKILSIDQITPTDLEQLSEAESSRLMGILTERFNKLKGTERDKFYKKIEPITSDTIKNQLWENNHNQITWAISTLMQECGRMGNHKKGVFPHSKKRLFFKLTTEEQPRTPRITRKKESFI